jgi:8-amino-7-oxononanoate synthase
MHSALSRTRSSERFPLAEAAQEYGFWPYFRFMEGPAGPLVRMEGGEKIMLGSNNYLGLTGDPRVIAGARDALDRYGTALTGSRLLNGTLHLHDELEQELADWMGTEAALVFTTGYQANLGLLSALVHSGDVVVCDSANHASIIDGIGLSGAELRPFRHNRVDRLEAVLNRLADADCAGLVVVDGVFSMEGDTSPLREVAATCRAHGLPLMVDEAHGVGVLGERGAGACEAYGVEDAVALRAGTFSKSLASCGGFVAGSREAIEFLRLEARSFLFTAASVPAALGAALAALRITRSAEGAELRARLAENAAYLRSGLGDLGFDVPPQQAVCTPIVAIRIGDDLAATCLWKALFDAGVYVNVAAYPAVPRNGALLRASVMASHSREQLDAALARFQEVRDEAEQGAFANA